MLYFQMFGLPGLLCTISQNFGTAAKPRKTVQLYGPRGLRRFLRTSLKLSCSHLGFNYAVHELVPTPDQFPADWEVRFSTERNFVFGCFLLVFKVEFLSKREFLCVAVCHVI